jgi:TPP-dependent 2-oxoacid decarboxylase
VSVVADGSFCAQGTINQLTIKRPNSFFKYYNWLAIGYSVPAAVGLKHALVDKACELGGESRVIVVTGDGAF